MDADEIREGLRAEGERRARAVQDARLSSEARELVRWARAQGLEMTEVARLLGVSRQSVYRLLAEQEGAAE
jgi:DNA invertase Pin-like site-specific DNA recombinase